MLTYKRIYKFKFNCLYTNVKEYRPCNDRHVPSPEASTHEQTDVLVTDLAQRVDLRQEVRNLGVGYLVEHVDQDVTMPPTSTNLWRIIQRHSNIVENYLGSIIASLSFLRSLPSFYFHLPPTSLLAYSSLSFPSNTRKLASEYWNGEHFQLQSLNETRVQCSGSNRLLQVSQNKIIVIERF